MELGSADAFDRMGTLGVEEEFYIVDADGRPTSGIDDLVYGPEPPELLSGRLDHELFEFTIETQTPLIEDLSEVADAVTSVREALVDHASNHGYRIAAAGLHPVAKWRELDHATKPRYQAQLDRIQYPQHRNTTAGLHVHVGIDDADKAVWIANELRWYLAPLLALSANSPFWNGFDTGLASARAKIFENLPNTGMPTAFDDFDDYQQFERRMVEHGSIDDRGELWYDVRPHTGHGTVEIRTPDAQTDPDRVVDFVEYVYTLVLNLADRYESGESRTDVRREILDENKWRATRHGRDASFITPNSEGVVSLESFVETESDRLDINGLRSLFAAESGANIQRRIHDESGTDALCEYLTLD
ncbi:glutamate--cysteine ligase [Haloferax mediterranei ATCC 33500]|uniref:Glutamate--cysteine ligase n=1 Tax=Haloferax mediterranei (strain ATCC 33500 / DSM 1411 / JCM 8866 / NBRC 14739 / NCIMB 2177 / R-4) TaxID=523841 RepID=I3R5F6_HALMT|nr:glutamate--cysteine ligase [Haloferax mediterranei]AFK19466.1 carboxylate-amine ligase [Haloferax mediterranei ATCC 33500]AHZ21188.1 carboxylate--amine ligase [Haloferax mediterranei ATCC 33500]EMA04347.1 carboxylate-amine ligase [Haloferax mediterranei ATCC 33500]MDX5989568.1 glutamate--cysteine ligase [Haloferax mediterranei ATCC 33500]QCQ75926.1 glutamate--cysteine ligase [Haloferax mediterranei ATCC 33500]